MVRFIDRTEETRVLERDWATRKNAFIVVFGRRRIGKTRLVENFVKDKDGAHYTAEDSNKKVQINEFKQIMASHLNDEFLSKQEIGDWGALFAYLTKTLDKNKKMYIWIDELSYLIKNDDSLTSVLQKFIDSFQTDSRIFLIVSGSIFGLMNEKILSHSSPLYGRRTRDILLGPIPSGFIREFIHFSQEDAIKTSMTINGIPEYLKVASAFDTYKDFIQNEFFKPEGYFYREPFFLLSQEFREIKTYFSIIHAIAYGNSRPSDIANFVGLDAREIYPYLELLINYGFVARETSMLGDRKIGLYHIKDNFLDFWFNLVHKNRESIERGNYKANEKELNMYLGKRFEIFIRENLHLFFEEFDSAGRWWHKGQEIDIVAVNETARTIMFGECKWQDRADAWKIAKELAEKSKLAEWHNGQRKEQFMIFAKSFTRKIDRIDGRNVHCFDLKDIAKTIECRDIHPPRER
ncbi:MAG: ATP-binding protein [Nanoarchaeota archaeon]